MIQWVYVLLCEHNYIYIGETSRLYGRFKEHNTGRGAKNTIEHKPIKLIGLYKVNNNNAFLEYRRGILLHDYNPFLLDNWKELEGDNLLIENRITERYFFERRTADWDKIKGGKYTKDITANPIDKLDTTDLLDRPLCKCGYPSEIKLSKDKTFYFICPLKNIWDDFKTYIKRDDACDFWQLYTEDIEIKVHYNITKNRSKEEWVKNIPLSLYKINPESCIWCNKINYTAIFNSGTRRLCQSCMFNNYEEIKEKYNTVCLIKI